MSNNSSLLIVDDDKDIREMLRMAMTASGYAVTTACDGLEALEAIQQDSPGAVLLDLMMPRMSGFEVIDTLRGQGQLDELPIIVLTAKDLDDPDYEMLNGTRAIFRKGSLDVFALAGRICDALNAA